MKYHRIPDEVVCRLPAYLRVLQFLSEQGVENISSRRLAEVLRVNSSQIRKDFSYFGSFGTRGVGYKITQLVEQLRKILKLNVTRHAALVGAGSLGSALLQYPGFRRFSFDVSAAFDADPKKIGKKVNDIIIEDVTKLQSLKRRKINIAIVAVPEGAAQQIVETLVKAGVKCILNFSSCYLTVPKRVKILTIDIPAKFARLPYYVACNQ